MTQISETNWITRTAALLALLVGLQAATSAFGNTILTGTVVNLTLILAVMACGIKAGLSVALLSPIAAKLIGIGPLWSLLPFIAAGNLVLVLIWHVVGNQSWKYAHIAALILAATAKFLVLFIGIVQFAVPLLLKLPEPQGTIISNLFSLPQLVTALLGGAAALFILPLLRRALMKVNG